MEESSGKLPLKDYDWSGEIVNDCEDYETNCTSNELSEKHKRNEEKIIPDSDLNPISASGNQKLIDSNEP